jgi:ABC-type branched-subunit amino acid transport system substrate-binding protein
MTMKLKGFAAAVLFLMSLLSVAANVQAAEPYKFAWISNITGPAGVVQKIPLIMLKAYMNRVNSQGGINGRQVVIQDRDVAGDTPRMLVDIRTTANDPAVLAVLGLGLSGQVEAAVPLLGQLKVTGVSNPATAPSAESPYYYSLGLNFAGLGRVAGTFLAQKGKALKVGVIGFDSPGLRASAEGMRGVLEGAGGKVVAAEFVPQSATDASAAMSVILSKKPDWIVVSGALDALSKSILDYLKLHKAEQIPMLWINNGCSSQMMSRANRDNFFATCHVAAASAGNSSIGGISEMRAIAAKFGGEDALTGVDDGLTGFGIAMGKTLEQALRKCGAQCDREGFGKALETVKLDLHPMMSRVDFSQKNHLAFLEGVVLRWDPQRGAQVVASDWLSLAGK